MMRSMLRNYFRFLSDFSRRENTDKAWVGIKTQSSFYPPRTYSFNEITQNIYESNKSSVSNKHFRKISHSK